MLKTKAKIIITLIAIFIAMCLLNIGTVQAVEMTEANLQEIIDAIPNTMELDIPEIEYKKAKELVEKNIKQILDNKNFKYEETDKGIQLKDATIEGYQIGITTKGAEIYLEKGIHQIDISIRPTNGVINHIKEKSVELVYSNTKEHNSADEKYIKNLKIENPIYYEMPFDYMVEDDGMNNFFNAIGEYHTNQINDESIIVKGEPGMGGADGWFNIGGEKTGIGIFKNGILYDIRDIGEVTSVPVIRIPETVEDDQINDYILKLIKQYYPKYVNTITKIEKGSQDLVNMYGINIPKSYTIYSDDINGYIIVRKEYEENLITKIVPDGKKLVLKSVKPNKNAEPNNMLTNMISSLFVEDRYFATGYYTNEDFTECIITIYEISGAPDAFRKDYKIEVAYDEPEKNVVVDSIVKQIKKFEDWKMETYYQVTDLNLINYYMNSLKENEGITGNALKYSEDIIKLLDGGNISFALDIGAGAGTDETIYHSGYGGISVFYNGYIYANMAHGVYLKRVIYIPEDTKETKEDYILAAQKRIDEYLGEKSNVKVEYGGLLSSLKEELKDENIPSEKTDGNYYNITINGQVYRFYIMKGIKKELQKPKFIGKHIESNIKITTNDSTVPLDTSVKIEPVKDEKINKKIGTDNYEAFEIKLYSDSKQDWITKLDNGKFSVSIPISEKLRGKDITIYYLSDDGIEEYETVIKDGFAVFETNHFSTYILAEKVEKSETIQDVVDEPKKEEITSEKVEENVVLDNEPKTGIIDMKLIIGIILVISIITIVKNKRQK